MYGRVIGWRDDLGLVSWDGGLAGGVLGTNVGCALSVKDGWMKDYIVLGAGRNGMFGML